MSFLDAHAAGLTLVLSLALAVWGGVFLRRASMAEKVAAAHDRIWREYADQPELHGLKEAGRDMTARPLTEAERRFAASVFHHLREAYRKSRVGAYAMPEQIGADVRALFALPAFSAAWEDARRYHDRAFVEYFEGLRDGR